MIFNYCPPHKILYLKELKMCNFSSSLLLYPERLLIKYIINSKHSSASVFYFNAAFAPDVADKHLWFLVSLRRSNGFHYTPYQGRGTQPPLQCCLTRPYLKSYNTKGREKQKLLFLRSKERTMEARRDPVPAHALQLSPQLPRLCDIAAAQ